MSCRFEYRSLHLMTFLERLQSSVLKPVDSGSFFCFSSSMRQKLGKSALLKATGWDNHDYWMIFNQFSNEIQHPHDFAHPSYL